MDYTGTGKLPYKVNRPLTQAERANHLAQKKRASDFVRDELSVIKLNSTYMELVDRWYAIKGWNALFTLIAGGLLLFFFIGSIVLLVDDYEEPAAWGVTIFAVVSCGGLLWFTVQAFFVEAFALTHYPIRLNRKTKKVHAFRPDGSIIEADWRKLFFCVGEGKIPLHSDTYDIRAHVLDEDGETVRDTFTLAYCDLGNKSSVYPVWEYIRRYMETKTGVEENWRYSEFFMPLDGRREGLVFGIVRVFVKATGRPSMQLLFSPVLSALVIGRWIAMYTSRIPQWPAEIEARYAIDPDDPYRRDWRNNGRYSFFDGTWPVICFVAGVIVLVLGLGELIEVAKS